MKKKLFTVAMLALSFVALPAMARDNKTSECAANSTECVKGKRPDARKCANHFEGLNLTDAQKEKLKAIDRPCKKQADRAKEARQMRDSMMRADRTKYLADIKAVLTPEQYVQFLENSFVNRKAMNPKVNKKDGRHNGQMRRGNGPADNNGQRK